MTGRGRGEGVGEAVVAVDAGDLFDEVDLALEVEAPGGELDGEGVGGRVGVRVAAEGSEVLRETMSAGDAFGRRGWCRGGAGLRVTESAMGGRVAVRAATAGIDDVDEVAFDVCRRHCEDELR